MAPLNIVSTRLYFWRNNEGAVLRHGVIGQVLLPDRDESIWAQIGGVWGEKVIVSINQNQIFVHRMENAEEVSNHDHGFVGELLPATDAEIVATFQSNNGAETAFNGLLLLLSN